VNITVIGCGRWGTFIAWYLDSIGHNVTLYGREDSTRFNRLRSERTNGLVTLGGRVALCSDLGKALSSAETILISISAQNLRALMQELTTHPLTGKTLVLCMKGLEQSSGKRLSEIVREYAGNTVSCAVWVGPGHVQVFLSGVANCMVIDSDDEAVTQKLVNAFSSDLIRFYYGGDLIGNEVGAAAKNVIGIAAGILDGLGKTALKGALMSRGTREISRLIQAMGGNALTAYGLSHLGDYEATVFSPYSHNRQFGENFARGLGYTKLAEGVSTTKALIKLGEIHHVELPICEALTGVLFNNIDPESAINELFLRGLKPEF
jgi:glycerol-3-phosphate dehydrogenase (NAD(P)+)